MEKIETLVYRGGSRAAAASKMEYFAIMVNGFQPLTIITKHSILDVAAVLNQPLVLIFVKLLGLRLVAETQFHFYINFVFFEKRLF